ncbi:hypothetical protein ACFLX4_01195 [Chloroflexota bacterium]
MNVPGFNPRYPVLLDILVTDRHIREISKDSWAILTAQNDPPVLFQRGLIMVEMVQDDNGQPLVRVLNRPRLRGILDRVANYVRLNKKYIPTPADPPSDVVLDMLAEAQLPLPVLRGMAAAPIFAPSGKLISSPGYDPITGYYLNFPDGLEIPHVSDCPNETEIKTARELILNDLLVDFTFLEDADQAHAVVIMLQPFVRLLINGATPLYLVESSTPRTGKNLLTQVLAIPAAGQSPAVMTEGRDEDEWRKRITSKLMAAPQFIQIDNIRSRLDSAALSSALTALSWEDRILGESRIVTLPINCTWLATANNPRLSSEIARRTVAVRLDSPMERLWERTDFKHKNLESWTKQHRSELIRAVITLVQAWIAAGKPLGREIIGSYESWSEVMGGVLEVAGIPGFLGNRQRVYAEADEEVLDWVEFLTVWWQQYQDMPVTTNMLFNITMEHNLLLDVWAGHNEHAGRTRFGKAIASMRDRVIGDYRIRRAGKDSHTKGVRYSLEPKQSQIRLDSAGLAGVNSTPLKLTTAIGRVEGKSRSENPRNAPQPPQKFVPTADWQEVPAGVVLPGKLELRKDFTTGKKFARIPVSDSISDSWSEV